MVSLWVCFRKNTDMGVGKWILLLCRSLVNHVTTGNKLTSTGQFPHLSSVQSTHSIVSDSLRPHGLQHARPPCPSQTPRVYSNSCPLSQRCHPTILILCLPPLLPPSIFPSIGVFSNETALRIRWPKYWSIPHLKERTKKYLRFPSSSKISWI